MNYEEFKQREDEKRERLRADMQVKANIKYNKGLFKGLDIKSLWIFPLLKRSI